MLARVEKWCGRAGTRAFKSWKIQADRWCGGCRGSYYNWKQGGAVNSCPPRSVPMQTPIPFTRPCITGREGDYVAEVVRSGQLGSDGRFTRRCADLLQQHFGIRKVMLTPSCTAALEMAAIL